GEERWRVLRKDRGERLGDDPREIVLLDAIPGAEQETAARLQDAASLAIASDPVRKEHHPELAAHDIERAVVEWQVESIGLLPGDPLVRRLPAGCYRQH